MNGELEARDNSMVVYLLKPQEKIAKLMHFSLMQLPREQNSNANALENMALAVSLGGQQTIIIENLPHLVLNLKKTLIFCTKTAKSC